MWILQIFTWSGLTFVIYIGHTYAHGDVFKQIDAITSALWEAKRHIYYTVEKSRVVAPKLRSLQTKNALNLSHVTLSGQ